MKYPNFKKNPQEQGNGEHKYPSKTRWGYKKREREAELSNYISEGPFTNSHQYLMSHPQTQSIFTPGRSHALVISEELQCGENLQ